MAKPKGSPKTGGRIKGTPNKTTLDKLAAREALRQIVTAKMEQLVDAQLHNAMGIGHLMLRDRESGKFERVVTTGDPGKDKAVIDAAVSTGNACWVYLKDPSIQAFTDLMNRALDKPAEQTQEVEHKGSIEITWKG